MGELKDYISRTQDAGTVHISEDVIASIAAKGGWVRVWARTR